MSRCLAISHKQFGDLVLLERNLKQLSRASGSKVDLIRGSGFQPLISLVPHVGFRRTPGRRAYEWTAIVYVICADRAAGHRLIGKWLTRGLTVLFKHCTQTIPLLLPMQANTVRVAENNGYYDRKELIVCRDR
jgi:hypothetical protein